MERAASILAALALFLIMVMVASDVAMRYLFDWPWGWSDDFISLYVIVAIGLNCFIVARYADTPVSNVFVGI